MEKEIYEVIDSETFYRETFGDLKKFIKKWIANVKFADTKFTQAVPYKSGIRTGVVLDWVKSHYGLAFPGRQPGRLWEGTVEGGVG